MSWLTPAVIASPTTSTSSNDLFGNQSKSQSQQTTRFRTISTTSASFHLARQKSEMDLGDDNMSLKSYKSGGTFLGSSNNNYNGGGGGGRNHSRNGESRSRATSTASIISRRTERMDTDSSSITTSNSTRPSSPNDATPSDRPEAIDDAPAIKRQKRLQEERRPTTQEQHITLPRSTSWFGSLDWRSGSSVASTSQIPIKSSSVESLSHVDSAPLTPARQPPRVRTTKPPKFSRSLSTKSSISSASPIASTSTLPFPSFPNTSSTSTLRPPAPLPSPSPPPPPPPAQFSTEPPQPLVQPLENEIEATPRARTTSTMSKKASWFGPSLYASGRNPPPESSESSPASESAISVLGLSIPSEISQIEAPSRSAMTIVEPAKDSTSNSNSGSGFLEVPGAEQERLRLIQRNEEKVIQLQASTDESSKKEQEKRKLRESKSWMSSISKYAGVDLGRNIEQEDSASKMDVDELSETSAVRSTAPVEVVDAPITHPQATIKATPVDESTITSKSIKRNIPSINQRLSWWNWKGPVESTVEESIETVTEEEIPVTPPTPVVEVPIKLQQIIPPVAEVVVQRPKTWYRTLIGESTASIAEREAEEELMAKRLAATTLEEEKKARALEMLPPPVPTSANSNDGLPRSLPAVQALKHKASWAFFPSRGSSSTLSEDRPSTAPNSPSTNTSEIAQAQAIPRSSTPLANSSTDMRGRSSVAKTVSLLSKSPRTGYVPSTASSRTSSRGDPNTISAPNSPLLRPVNDQPLKPLTGSIRSNQRLSPSEPEPLLKDLVLPSFSDTFSRPPRSFPMKKSKLTKVVSVMSAYWYSTQPTASDVEEDVRGEEMRKFDPAERLPKSFEKMGEVAGRLDKIQRVVTIGVHGWFPNPMLKSVFGEPTGTSVKFSTMMHDAVQTYLESHDKSSFNIQAIALEGEGQVSARVDLLYAQLIGRPEWIEALRKADAVFVSTHSQGTVVSTHLIDRMLNEGLVEGSKTHLLAMCGIAQGPFIYLSQSYALQPYFNYLESAAARELFEFQDPESAVAKRFLDSLTEILSHGVKITTVGSINDQVVPLYSALFAGISHPSILRAVFIDGQAFRTSDFLANLVVFAARLRNAGLQDHDLIYHLSEALAGALTGVGHSKVYEEEEVFNLAVRYQFETTPLAEAPTFLQQNAMTEPLSISFNPRDRRNPYLLTWSLRGIVEDPQVRELFGNELSALREAYDTWKPQTKVLKDTKLKLEGIRSLSFQRGGKL